MFKRSLVMLIGMLLLLSTVAFGQAQPVLVRDACDTGGCWYRISYPEGGALPLYVAWVLDDGALKLTKATDSFLLTADHTGTKEVRAHLIYNFDVTLSRSIDIMFPSNPFKHFVDSVKELAADPVIQVISGILLAIAVTLGIIQLV